MELGPFWLVKPNGFKPYDVVRNNFTWTKDYNILFVDQPVGTGLSYADPTFPNVYVKNMTDLATDFYNALKELYQNPSGCFSKINIKGSDPLIIFGESYAGKYAPAIGLKILTEAK
jgi:vitellogenic carboxypeptidase-like protein/serine carboxypeptidase 1